MLESSIQFQIVKNDNNKIISTRTIIDKKCVGIIENSMMPLKKLGFIDVLSNIFLR
jgi:hypothetical protein